MIVGLRPLLELHEGRRLKKYKDSLGYWTIAVGCLIDPKAGGRIPTTIQAMLDHADIDVWADEAITEAICDAWRDHAIERHQTDLAAALSWVVGLDEVRLAVLTDMAFNLGVPRLLGFKKTLEAVKERRYADAANEMLDSDWARQVGKRALRLATMMRSGLWPVS